MSYVADTYLLQSCPFSFKFLLYVAEAGLLDKINVIELVHGAEGYEETKAMLSEKLGKPASFPTVEIEPGVFMNESDELIQHFTGKFSTGDKPLNVVPFYERGLMAKLMTLYKENGQYKAKYGEL